MVSQSLLYEIIYASTRFPLAYYLKAVYNNINQ